MARNLGWSAYAWRRRLRARGGVKTGVPDGVFIEQEAYYGTRVEAMRVKRFVKYPWKLTFCPLRNRMASRDGTTITVD